MAPRHTGNDSNTQSARYRLPVVLAAAGALLLVLGFIIPAQVWNLLLVLLGFILLIVAAFSIRVWFVGNWIPTLFAEKGRDNTDDIPPPPTLER